MSERLVRIGGASGAWGDSPMAIPQLLTSEIDYLVMDFLAEITMSLLARARMKDPADRISAGLRQGPRAPIWPRYRRPAHPRRDQCRRRKPGSCRDALAAAAASRA